ncbi:MAG: family efflux transporter [Labilithrix sp.]|nr:family efflux transporter [Labilithrix sp.]
MNRPASGKGLTEGAVGKTLFVFTLPILFSNVLQSLNGSINAIWVGRYLGAAALTAAANANTILFFLIGLVFGVAMAASILIGQSVGARDTDAAKRVVGTSAGFFFVASIAVSVLGFVLTERLLAWMRTPDDALPYAISYLRMIFVAMPFIFVNAFVTMVLRGAGDAKTPLLFSLLAVGLDIVLNPILLFGWGPFPKLGIAGAATATLIAYAVSCIALVWSLYRKDHFLCLRRHELAYLRIDRAILGSLVKKGLPMGMQMIVMSGSAIVMISLVNGFGVRTTAAFGAGMQLWNYIQMPAMAVGMAASAMAAQNVGAKQWDRVGRTAVAGVAINVVMTGTLAALIWLFDRGALGLFSKDPATIAEGMHLNAIVVWSFPFFGVSMVLSSVVRSTGAVIPPLAILFLSLWGLRIPFAVLMLDRWQADAIWWSFPLASLVSMLLSMIYYRYGRWRTARMI